MSLKTINRFLFILLSYGLVGCTEPEDCQTKVEKWYTAQLLDLRKNQLELDKKYENIRQDYIKNYQTQVVVDSKNGYSGEQILEKMKMMNNVEQDDYLRNITLNGQRVDVETTYVVQQLNIYNRKSKELGTEDDLKKRYELKIKACSNK